MPEFPDMPQMGEPDRPPSIAELRFARAFLVTVGLVLAVLLVWHWAGDGALWLGLLFGFGLAVCAVGALSTHGQLHGWDALRSDDTDDAPEASPEVESERSRVPGDGTR